MKTVLALFIIPFKFLFEHKKLALILIAGIIGFVIYNGQFKKPEIVNDIPDYLKTAPRGVPVMQTVNRLYCVVDSQETESLYILRDFYAYDDKWVRYKIPLEINKNEVVEWVR